MSRTDGFPEPAESNPQPRGNILAESVNTIIRVLGLSSGAVFSQHAAQKEHEDVPSDVVKVPEDKGVAIPKVEGLSAPVPIRNFASKCPDRLRPLLPPANFGAVVPGSIFRSSYPQPENLEFLKTLKLKTVLTLVPEPIPTDNLNFMLENGIQHFQVHIPANKGEISIPTCQMSKALGIVLDRSNHPILIHCNKGKCSKFHAASHRLRRRMFQEGPGSVDATRRKASLRSSTNNFQGEELHNVFDEYHTYADPKARILDECFMEIFDERTVLWMARRYNWILPSAESDPPPSPVPALGVVRPRA
ncbi:uncharacterized protein BDR25DRAFT_317308 [Lindgomyces ingoldianus]|uniref:Uncharacterized protein n=1 Tax=Lindgomyces ingoldianus TaxID=673940 RepID=A0ACB6QLU4_9PLEO|nr:uncharacterized protein BDR25DRAFT_317308 [Lindgomyces ingoldianus]KAF2467090.1 hypothetical protein BDR25DRAFT_317308 [Lindgomyces ingoldianus]